MIGAAVAALSLIALSANAAAQSIDAKFVEALAKRLETVEKENSALRQRVHRLESGNRQVAAATPNAPASSAAAPALPSAPLFNSRAMSAQASVNKAPMGMMMPSDKWNGVYVGVHGGYAFSNWLPPAQGTGLSQIELNGGFGGIQAGYNIQLSPHWLIGVEQDVSFGKVSGTASQPFPGPVVSGKTEAFGTVRARFGYILGDALLYETTGIAWAYNTGGLNFITPAQQAAAGADALTYSEKHLQWGVAVGGGIEWFVMPSLSVKGEFQYIYLTKEQFFGGTTESATAGWPVASARLGLNWHLH